jgi:class 3 adenylate cyclase/tetratricopeptide (TPR) repeat protein
LGEALLDADGIPMSEIREWLAAHGFERFSSVFEENEVDLEALRELTDDDLKEMGLPLGPRVKLRKAISALAEGVEPPAAVEAPTQELTHGDAERRQLTVMFVDMVGSTRLSAELDPEDMRQLLLAYQSAVSEAVTRHGGHIARYFGDGVLCYFGWPRAHENAAEESVRAGLAAAEAVEDLHTAAKTSLAARVGIATGLVVVGDIIGEGAAEEEAVVGETPNLAARLQGLAGAGQVVVSDTTRRLIAETFSVASLGDVELKGFSSDVDAFVVTGEKSSDAHFEARASSQVSDLVGREHELAMIQDRWQRALGGEGQAVLLLGEAGIGKSRIVEAFCEELQDEKHYRIRQRWTPFHTDTPLYGSVQHVLSIANFQPEDTDDIKLDKLEALLFEEKHVPIFAELLGVDASKRYGAHGLTSEQLRDATLHALADETVAIARRRPVCMILEDAHWMDASSFELARVTFEKLRNERILVLMPARPDLDPAFANHPAFTRISLNRLGTQEVHRIIHSLAGGKSLPAALVDDITAKTDGVPLFVEEVTKSVLESDHVIETADAFELAVPVDSLAVPATLQDSLMARLDRQPSAKEVAQVAACMGRDFDAESLRAITGFSEGVLTDALDQLCEVEVVSRRGIAPNLSYRFRHALLCDAAYQSLLKGSRRDIHARIVAHLESRSTSEPEIVAQHAYQAGMIEKAVADLRAAVSRDFGQSAYREASAHAAKALRWIQELPESEERLLAEAKLEVMQAYALIPHEGYSSQRTTRAFDRATDIALMTGDISISVPAMTGKALVRMTRGDHAHLASTTDELQRICDDDGRDYMRFFGAMMKGFALILRGELAEGRRLVAQAKSLYVDDHERRGLRAGYPMWDSLTWWEQMGAWLSADTSFDDAIAESMDLAVRGEHDLDRPAFARCWQPTFSTFIALGNSDLDLARALATRALDLSTTHDIPSYVAWNQCVLSIHEMAHGDVEQAFEQFRAAGRKAAETEFGWGQPTFRVEMAKAALARGRVEEARQICGEAADVLSTTRELWWQAEALRTEGDVCVAEGNRDGAERLYRKAIEIARAQGASTWERRAEASLAELGPAYG